VDSENPNYSSVSGVFYNKSQTTLIRYPIGKSASSFSIPSGVTTIMHNAFSRAISLNSVTVPASVTTIEAFAFYESTSIVSVYFLSNAPASIGDYAFMDVASGAKAHISATATGFGNEQTWNGLLIAVSAPENGSYKCATGLPLEGDDTSPAYTITDGVVSSGSGCVGAVVIPAGATSIGDSAFYNATSLTSITIPGSVTSIGVFAFSNATSLTSINIPASVTSIGNQAFRNTTALASITVDGANPSYSSTSGVLFNKNSTTLITYPLGKNNTFYAIPTSVTSIGDSAFYKATALNSIVIPASVTSIEDYAFYGADSLKDVYFLGNAPTYVGEEVFYGIARGAKAIISTSATGFGSAQTWNGLVVSVTDIATYTVTYNAAGGTPVSPGSFTIGGTIQAKPVSTRAGYTLTGWSTTANGTVVTFPYRPTATSNIKLYAIWTRTKTPTTTPKKTAISSYAAKFSTGSSVIPQTGKAAISKIVSKSGKDAKYTVTGVATKVAGVPDSHVKGLAKVRAEKVKAYLIGIGVKKSNISIAVKILEYR
jgi:uncharacterized repeat protein (TIGR02543 family)